MPAQGTFSPYVSPTLNAGVLEPGIRKFFDEGATANEWTAYDKIFRIESSTKAVEHLRSVSDLGPQIQIQFGQEYPFEQFLDGRQTDFVHVKLAKAIGFPVEVIEDDQYNVVSRGSAKLGRSRRVTKEIIAAAVFNNGFTVNGSDGVPLASATHPLLSGGGATWSNLGASADPSYSTILALQQLLMIQPDEANTPLMYLTQPMKYMYHPSFHTTVMQSLKSPTAVTVAGSANANANIPNAINTSIITPVPNPFLSDTGNNQSWLVVDGTELYFFNRKDPGSPEAYDDKTNDTIVTKHAQRISAGYASARGIVGTPGST